MRKHIAVVAAMTLVVIVFAGCDRSLDAATEASAPWVMERVASLPPLPVEVVAAERTRLVPDIGASGMVSATREVTIVAETQGVVQAASFELGEPVEAGQVLVTFDSLIQVLTVEEARQALTSAELTVATTERLVGTGNASQAQLTQARGALAGARARLAQAEKALADRTLIAPFDGLVAARSPSVEPGNFVSAGVMVARIIDTSRMEIRLSVGEREIRYLRVGGAAFVSIPAAGPGEIRAEIAAIAAGSDPQTGSFPVVVRWQQPPNTLVRAGLSARVRIPPVGAPTRLVVPAGAVITRGDERSVFVAAAEGVAERRVVTVGEREGERVAILSGVEPGELVVVSGLRTLAHGDRVAPTVRTADAMGAAR
ncbi:MAG: efflux RND transporter periplasmic adaptor subunit [Spirochaetaceae bacterium]|nr:MAG: efflux RND transporter periplasmic adaptor subunit [Spirochaetaceae bacterium]